MEINPYESRLRMLQQIDGVQMQREAAPDEETAGCPGCPFFWTCPVPHRGEEVRTPAQIELEDVREVLGRGREFHPRDESDIGWTDVWVDENGDRLDEEELRRDADVEADEEPAAGADEDAAPDDAEDVAEPARSGAGRHRRADRGRAGRGWFRRRRRRG